MDKVNSKIKYLRNPRRIIRALGVRGLLNWIPDKPYLKLVYWGETGKKLNLDNPKTFNEKLQWIKLYDRKPEYSTYVDKYSVREYISEKIGDKYLVPLIGVYNNVDEIVWDELPDKFVIKCTHGSSCNIICSDKSKLNIEEAKVKLNRWMKKSWFWFGREWPYKNVKPRIICEEYISENDEVPDDYKVMCFNGEPKCIQVHKGRFKDHLQNFYDTEWNLMELSQGLPNINEDCEKPEILNEMLEISRVLSKDINHVRVDFYYVNKKLYFGELTFFDASGFYLFEPEEYDYLLGSWIKLS